MPYAFAEWPLFSDSGQYVPDVTDSCSATLQRRTAIPWRAISEAPLRRPLL